LTLGRQAQPRPAVIPQEEQLSGDPSLAHMTGVCGPHDALVQLVVMANYSGWGTRVAGGTSLCLADSDRGGNAVAVKQVRVSDLSGRQASEDQFAKLIVHEHPQFQGPITLDVLPEELGELPDSDQYVSIEVIQPGERSGQRVLLSVERFNQLAAGGDMHAILMNAVSALQPPRPAQPRRRGRGRGTGDGQARDGRVGGRGKVEWGLPHRGRISPEEAAYVRDHLDEVQQLRSERGVPLLDPADPKTKQRYGL
jgi:hypothetical protein